ncbi:Lpg0189 family type II secretion system effector [Legionella rowbothamii]|uniref:Lpg0189 family type II secretion system effector n=1 Tax=Legionella rowbothamii TaxID=96229 RepID=UPI0010541953|nr:Lpg0189 family type II secretion system effector [Legionella rowbothamii]
MKFNSLVVALVLVPLFAFSHPNDNHQAMSLTPTPEKNTRAMSYSNESTTLNQLKLLTRNIDYPTQIIRMESEIKEQQITCNEVHNQINKILVDNIVNEHFIYAIYISCHYDPQTFLATQFIINSYFDPVNDEAVAYLENYLQEYNGSTLFDTQFKIEQAKGLIISLSFAAGMKKNPIKPPFTEYRRDRSNFYFKSNYEMKHKLFNDVNENFYSNNPDKVLPFLDRWLFANAGSLYKGILRDSNYAELQPERIFLMDNGETIFVSGVKQYFMNHCEKYDNHRCLQPNPKQ